MCFAFRGHRYLAGRGPGVRETKATFLTMDEIIRTGRKLRLRLASIRQAVSRLRPRR